MARKTEGKMNRRMASLHFRPKVPHLPALKGDRPIWGASGLLDRVLNERGIAQVLGVADPEILRCRRLSGQAVED
jgi:hypothetical protein